MMVGVIMGIALFSLATGVIIGYILGTEEGGWKK